MSSRRRRRYGWSRCRYCCRCGRRRGLLSGCTRDARWLAVTVQRYLQTNFLSLPSHPTTARYLCHHYATTYHPSSYHTVYAPKSTAPPLTMPFVIINSHHQSYCLFCLIVVFIHYLAARAFAIRPFSRNTVIYKKNYVCQSQPSLRALLSALQPVVTSSFHAPGANSATGHSPSLVRLRGTVCLWTSELHRHHLHLRTCLKHICFIVLQ